MRRFALVASLLWTAGGAAQQPTTFAAPLLGFVHDPAAAAIHPLAGVPGAALLQARLDLGFSVSRAVAAPRRRLLLVVSADDQSAHLVRAGDQLQVTPVDSGIAPTDAIAWSPSGETAAIYRHAAARIRILSPAARDMEASLCESALLAVNDDGSAAMARCGDTSYLATERGVSRLSVPAQDPFAAFAFRPASREAIAVTRSGDLWRVDDTGSTQLLRTAAIPFEKAITVRTDTQGRIYVLSADGKLAVLEDGAVSTYDCRCEATTLDPTEPETLFAITRLSHDTPLRLFDAARRRFWFVPAYSPEATW